MKPVILALSCAVFVVACSNTTPRPEVNRLAERSGVITLPDPETGTCRANDVTPAVIDTVTEQIIIQPAELNDEGRVIVPAQYRTETRQIIVEDRKEQQFDALCQAELTPEFVSNLQRALAVRGFYKGPASGELNWRTRRAVRLYQMDQGVNSAIVSIETARQLGLTAYNFES